MKQNYSWIVACGIMLALSAMLAGCTSLSIPSVAHAPFHKETWWQRHRALTRVRRWNIDGAFSVRQPHKSVIAAYTWQQRGRSYSIRIHSSLNIYSAAITGRPGYVTLQRSKQQRFSARSPERLMEKQFGWHLPLSTLFYWIRGLPAPGKDHAKFDVYGHVAYLQQAGWRVRFSNYVPVGTVDLPRTLQLNNSRFSVKIVIKHWKL